MIACIYSPHFSLRVALLERPELDGLPLVLAAPSHARPTVQDCTPEAARQGVRVGMPLREVVAICPQSVFLPPNPARYTAITDRITETLETLSPLVESDVLGRWYLDLRGFSLHNQTDDEMAQQLLQMVSPLLRPRVGLAPGKFTAWVAARRAAPGSWQVVAASDVSTFLAKVPISWLPLTELVPRLERLGVRTLGELTALPPAALAARFGAIGQRAWKLASGHDEQVVVAREREETVTDGLTLPAPTASREMLLLGLRQIIGQMFSRPELRNRQIRQARLRILIENNRSWENLFTFRSPMGRQQLTENLQFRVQSLELPGAAEGLSLELIGLVTETAYQERLLGFRTRQNRPLVDATRQLKQRYGVSPLYHIVEVEPWSRIPERRHALVSYDP